MKLTLEKAKALAKENYEKGGDGFVECYTDEELAEYITGMTVGQFRKDMAINHDINQDMAGW